ncbi:D-glucuronyl C5-epimerase family protein [Actinokineospora sp. 24-640]
MGPADGVARPPAAGSEDVARRTSDMEAKSGLVARPPLGAYLKANHTPRPLTGTGLPYNSPTLYGWDRGVPRDSTGVRMFAVGNVLHNHPVAQAQDGLMALSDHRLTGEARYLQRARLNAQRLIDKRVLSDGAWYYPYPFDFAVHGLGGFVLRAPWFSAMAQGQALSLHTRLYQLTGEQRWRDAADAGFASFRNAPVQGLPSTVNVDSAGYLWLEEYPRWPTTSSDRTLNGHVFATFGLYDYHRLTGDPVARDLWNGSLAHTRHYLVNGFRAPNYASRYCLVHPTVQPASYHEIHWSQMLTLHASTGDALWSRYADLLRADYPPPAVTGTVVFRAGTHTGHRFSASGAITASRTITLSRQSSAPTTTRQRIRGRGVMVTITAGALAGYAVPENWQRAWIAGAKVGLTYPLPRTVQIPAGSRSAYKYSPSGALTAWTTITPPRTTSAPFSTSATINGRWHILVTAGSLAGYWLPAQGVTLL